MDGRECLHRFQFNDNRMIDEDVDSPGPHRVAFVGNGDVELPHERDFA